MSVSERERQQTKYLRICVGLWLYTHVRAHARKHTHTRARACMRRSVVFVEGSELFVNDGAPVSSVWQGHQV